jgi:hypothetical protein
VVSGTSRVPEDLKDVRHTTGTPRISSTNGLITLGVCNVARGLGSSGTRLFLEALSRKIAGSWPLLSRATTSRPLQSIEQFSGTVEKYGGRVGRVLPLDGQINGVPNCLHPDIVAVWQMKGYSYRAGFCPNEKCCKRQADPDKCPFLASIDALEEAPMRRPPRWTVCSPTLPTAYRPGRRLPPRKPAQDGRYPSSP